MIRLVVILCLFMLSVRVVNAEIIPDTIYALTSEHIDRINITEELNLYVIKTGKLSKNISLEYGDEIKVKILNYNIPKRGKRNGYYNIEYEGEKLMTGTMRASTPKDLKQIASQTGIILAGTVLKVPGLSQAFAVTKGFVHPNENETRIESAGKNLYKSTPLPYIEKGNDFSVEKDGIVVIRLKAKEK